MNIDSFIRLFVLGLGLFEITDRLKDLLLKRLYKLASLS